MKKIKFLIFFVLLSSCNQYLGTIDPDYTPKNEVTEIFSNIQQYDDNILEIDYGDIIFPNTINKSINTNQFKIDKIINTDKNSVFIFVDDKIFISKDKIIYLIDNKIENNFEYDLKLNEDEKPLHIFEYNNEIYVFTNKSQIFVINEKKLLNVANFDILTNIKPIVLNNTLIILSVFGDIFEINLDNYTISKQDNFKSNPGISINSNLFEDKSNLYYLFNTGTLLTFNKNNYKYFTNFILQDLNILSSLGIFEELIDTPFSYNDYLYFLDRSGKVAAYNPFSSEILWEIDLNSSIYNYLFSNNGYLIILTSDKILTLSENGKIISSFSHNKESPLLIFNINKNIYLISEGGINLINLNDNSEDIFFKNKFKSNLEIYFYNQNIYLKDEKSLFLIK